MAFIPNPVQPIHALTLAERFISGFEDDDSQEGVSDLLTNIRAALADTQSVAGVPVGPAELIARLNRDLALLRACIDEPQVLAYSPDVYLEVGPADSDQRVNVCHQRGGWGSVNFAAKGLHVDIFNSTDVEPICELAYTYDELHMLEDA